MEKSYIITNSDLFFFLPLIRVFKDPHGKQIRHLGFLHLPVMQAQLKILKAPSI